MATCKNCDGAIAFSRGLCLNCLEEENEEIQLNGFECRSCSNLVKDEKDICAECKQDAYEIYCDSLREERMLNHHRD